MILFRLAQGFTGGVLIPLSFDVILTYLPQSKQPIGIALFTVTATFAPAISPLIGGWLTDNYGWPFIFYMNVVPAKLMIAIVQQLTSFLGVVIHIQPTSMQLALSEG